MKRKLFLLFLSTLFSRYSAAQRIANIGLETGVVNYIGDLANEEHFPFSSANAGVQLTFRDFLNNPEKSRILNKPFSLELRFSWHRLQYDETKPLGGKQGTELRNYQRGLGFRNDLFGTMVNFTYTHYQNRIRPLYKQKLAYFFLAGIGAFYGTPKADLFQGDMDIKNRYHFWSDGTIHDVAQGSGSPGNIIKKDGIYETDLRDWLTEGQGYSLEAGSRSTYDKINIGFPLGAGIRYGFNENITFSAEFDYYFFLTDYLDDVSERYATWSELAAAFPDKTDFELAKYISDPTGKGTTGTAGPYTSRRGNPYLKDSFTFLSIEVAYKITLKSKSIYGQLARN